jgi:hypothetical protein
MSLNMKKGGRSLMAALVMGGIALTIGLAAEAQVQQHADRAGGRGPFGPAAHFAKMCDMMDARQAGMLAFAEVRLGITDAERPAWTKFATAVKAASAPIKQVCASVVGQPEPKTLPDHLHRMEQIEAAHLEQLRQITPAVEELYGSLTAKQKEQADQLVGDMMRGPGPGPGMRPGMGRPPMPGKPDGDKAPN